MFPFPPPAPWPRRLKMYVHGDKETNWSNGKELGLNEGAQKQFSYALYEVTVELDVNEDGTYKIISFKE